MISFPKENNVYLLSNPNSRYFADLCLRITKINWIEEEFERRLKSFEIECALVSNNDLIQDPELFALLLKPFPLNKLVLKTLGFDKIGNKYIKTYQDKKKRLTTIEIVKDNGAYKICNMEDVDEDKKKSAPGICYLHELQEQVRLLFDSELPVDIYDCNHAICLLFSMNKYIKAIYSCMLRNNNRCYITWLPEVLRENYLFPMSEKDVELIISYLEDVNVFKINIDENGWQYLAL